MSGILRRHHLSPGAALNRRILEEMFMDGAQRFSSVNQWGLGDEILGRTNFKDEALEEYRYSGIVDVKYNIPGHGHNINGCYLQVAHEEEFFEGTITWSVTVDLLVSTCRYLVAWPVCNGQLLVGGHDSVDCHQLVKYSYPGAAQPALDPATAEEEDASDLNNSYSVGLGGTAHFSGVASRMVVGVLTYGLGSYRIREACIGSRKVQR